MVKTIFLLIACVTAGCETEELSPVPDPSVTPAVPPKIATIVPPLDSIDISRMPPLPPERMQTSMEDALGNKNQVLADIVANGKDSVPFLISKLDDETEMNRRVENFWYRLTIGDMALIILDDLFTDETEARSTIPGFSWDQFLERGDNKNITGEEVLRRYIRTHGRSTIKRRWQKLWDEKKENIFWDADCKCFRIDEMPQSVN